MNVGMLTAGQLCDGLNVDKNEKNLDKGVAKMFKRFPGVGGRLTRTNASLGTTASSSLARLARPHLGLGRD